jgi:hypothetical protein
MVKRDLCTTARRESVKYRLFGLGEIENGVKELLVIAIYACNITN